jgi:hypothetical protein
MINKIQIPKVLRRRYPPYSYNVLGLGAVAASNTFSTRATAGENSKYCPREVMPPLRQTLVRNSGCLPIHCPISDICPVKPEYFFRLRYFSCQAPVADMERG